jgi:hypothetical protein
MEQSTTVFEAFKTGTENMKQKNRIVQLCSNASAMNLQDLEATRRLLNEQQIKICLFPFGFRQLLTVALMVNDLH